MALRRVVFALSLPLFVSACGGSLKTDNNSGNSGDTTQKSEPSVCTSRNTYSGGVAISGSAEYYYRPTSVTLGLSGNPVVAAIPFAEVVVTNSSGAVVQCSETAANGSLSLTLPAGAGSYTLTIYSRADNTKYKASVLEDYYENVPYSISKSFSIATGETTKNIGTVTAYARVSESAKIEGAAFHILALIYKANEYIRSETSNASFVAPKVSVYWKKGFNPYNYFGSQALVSFYRPGTGQLFILGGDAGDVKNSDTDHFDNSVILHEYGHFLEDKYAKSDSPGGSHNGNSIIDPRLAWSEGWANFLQGAILRSSDSTWSYYIDTVGFRNDSVEGGSGSIAIKVDLTMNANPGYCHSGTLSKCDPVTTSGEGTYREMSISRFLYKTIIPTGSGGAQIPFSHLWTSFTDFSSSAIAYRNVGLFNQLLRGYINTNSSALLAGWDTLRGTEQQNANTRNYADSLNRIAQNTCATRAITPVADSSSKSNQFRSNAFFIFNHDGVSKTITLEYTGGSSGTPYNDLDLYLYREGYVFQETGASSNGSVVLSSARTFGVESGQETINLSGLAAGKYLINVKAYTYGKLTAELGGTMNYRLKVTQSSTTEDLCPAN